MVEITIYCEVCGLSIGDEDYDRNGNDFYHLRCEKLYWEQCEEEG